MHICLQCLRGGHIFIGLCLKHDDEYDLGARISQSVCSPPPTLRMTPTTHPSGAEILQRVVPDHFFLNFTRSTDVFLTVWVKIPKNIACCFISEKLVYWYRLVARWQGGNDQAAADFFKLLPVIKTTIHHFLACLNGTNYWSKINFRDLGRFIPLICHNFESLNNVRKIKIGKMQAQKFLSLVYDQKLANK